MDSLGKLRVASGAVATALMWLYLYMGMGASFVDDGGGPALRIFVSIGLVCLYVLTFAFPALLGRRSVRFASSVALVLVLGLYTLFEAIQLGIFSEAPVSYVCYLFRGICLGFAYSQMGVFLSLLAGRMAAMVLPAAMGAAALLNVLFGQMSILPSDFVLKAALMLSILLFLGVPIAEERRVRPARMFADYVATRPLFSELFLVSILYGFTVMFVSVAVTAGLSDPAVFGASYVVPALVLLLLVALFGKRIDFLTLRWIVLPVATVAIVPLTILPLGDSVFLLAVVLALFQVLEASSSLSLAESAREHGLPPISSFVLLRIAGTLGLLVGRIACMFMLSSVHADQEFLFRVAIAAIIVVLVVWRAFVTPSAAKGYAENELQPGGASSGLLGAEESDWQERRDAQLKLLASERELSERETEVFLLLAKGRNAEYIGKSLYISENTVRSHIQRIYRKLDTHSQQELLDFVEGSFRR